MVTYAKLRHPKKLIVLDMLDGSFSNSVKPGV